MMKNMKKIGLLTYHHTTNFGSLLQTYALYKAVTDFGHDCEIIDYRNEAVEAREFIKPLYLCRTIRDVKARIKVGPFRKKKAKAFRDFIHANMHVSREKYDLSNSRNMNGKYDCYLVGSDLVWDFTINNHDLTYMFNNLDDQSVRIAYASSVGQIWKEEDLPLVKTAMNKFKNIGVRERGIQEILNAELDKNVDFVCDPTMLISAEEWTSFVRKRFIEEKYVLVYMADSEKKIYSDALEYGRNHNLPVYAISFYPLPEGIKNVRPYEVSDFLSLILNAECVFSASYHGMLFSIYFKKEFFYYNRGWKERMVSLSNYLGLESRERYDSDKSYEKINYEMITAKVDEFRMNSLMLLNNYFESREIDEER